MNLNSLGIIITKITVNCNKKELLKLYHQFVNLFSNKNYFFNDLINGIDEKQNTQNS